jgi:hypothetical protein
MRNREGLWKVGLIVDLCCLLRILSFRIILILNAFNKSHKANDSIMPLSLIISIRLLARC